ncbi:MAG: hypothetical protein V4857_27200 [Pseudomonadota bacterium]
MRTTAKKVIHLCVLGAIVALTAAFYGCSDAPRAKLAAPSAAPQQAAPQLALLPESKAAG